jgi:hypothetical protein
MDRSDASEAAGTTQGGNTKPAGATESGVSHPSESHAPESHAAVSHAAAASPAAAMHGRRAQYRTGGHDCHRRQRNRHLTHLDVLL